MGTVWWYGLWEFFKWHVWNTLIYYYFMNGCVSKMKVLLYQHKGTDSLGLHTCTMKRDTVVSHPHENICSTTIPEPGDVKKTNCQMNSKFPEQQVAIGFLAFSCVTFGFWHVHSFIRCIGSGFIVELECSMRIQIPISGPDGYSMVYWAWVTIPRSEGRKYPEVSIVCP